MNKLPDEIRWHLAERRAQRLYMASPEAGLSYGPVHIGVAGDRFAAYKGAWVFQFGAYGDTHVLAYGELMDALEDAASWLKDNAPGHLTEPDYDEARKELAAEETELGLDASDPDELEESIAERAEADLTYTEAGWLVSHEWTCVELHNPSDLLAYVSRK